MEEQKAQEAKSRSDALDKKSEQLQKDRKVTETEIQVARNLLENAKKNKLQKPSMLKTWFE